MQLRSCNLTCLGSSGRSHRNGKRLLVLRGQRYSTVHVPWGTGPIPNYLEFLRRTGWVAPRVSRMANFKNDGFLFRNPVSLAVLAFLASLQTHLYFGWTIDYRSLILDKILYGLHQLQQDALGHESSTMDHEWLELAFWVRRPMNLEVCREDYPTIPHCCLVNNRGSNQLFKQDVKGADPWTS